jgi:hypothetical protein
MAMFTIDKKGFKQAAKMFDKAANALDYARRDYVNEVAFEARRGWLKRIEDAFVIRNTFTARSIRVEKARVAKGQVIESKVGSTAPYMDEQEEGGTKTAHGKHGAPIPTTSAAGQAMKARPRKRQVTARNRMGAINLASSISGRRQKRNAAAIAVAVRSGRNVAFLDLGKRKGIFRVIGGKRGIRVRMLWDLSKKSLTIPRLPTLEPTLKSISKAEHIRIGVGAMKQQFKRNRLFGF